MGPPGGGARTSLSDSKVSPSGFDSQICFLKASKARVKNSKWTRVLEGYITIMIKNNCIGLAIGNKNHVVYYEPLFRYPQLSKHVEIYADGHGLEFYHLFDKYYIYNTQITLHEQSSKYRMFLHWENAEIRHFVIVNKAFKCDHLKLSVQVVIVFLLLIYHISCLEGMKCSDCGFESVQWIVKFNFRELKMVNRENSGKCVSWTNMHVDNWINLF